LFAENFEKFEKIPQKFILKYFPKIVENAFAARFFRVFEICENPEIFFCKIKFLQNFWKKNLEKIKSGK